MTLTIKTQNRPYTVQAIHHRANNDLITNYLNKTPHSLFYATAEFSSLIADHLNCDTGWIVAFSQDDHIVGILPYAKKTGPWGPVYNSFAYYGSNGGVIQDSPDDAAKQLLIEFFYSLAQQDNAVSATIISNPLEKDAHFYETHTKYDLHDERIGQITPLPEGTDPDDLMKLFDDPRPRNIRRAIKEGVYVERKHDQDSINFLYNTHIENMGVIGGLAKDKEFFNKITTYIPDDKWAVYIAHIDNNPVAGLLLFYHSQTVEYFTPAIIESFRSSQALALTIYTAMQDAIHNGYKNWNWGGTWLSQGGVYDFKKRWGTNEYRYYYYTRIFDKTIYKRRKDEILNTYKGFYVLPFSALKEIEDDQS